MSAYSFPMPPKWMRCNCGERIPFSLVHTRCGACLSKVIDWLFGDATHKTGTKRKFNYNIFEANRNE